MNDKVVGNKFVRLFNDTTEMLDFAVQPPKQSNFWRSKLGFSDWTQVREKATAPHPDMVAIIDEMVDSLGETEVPDPVSIKRKIKFTEDTGDEIDLDRLNAGQPFWRSMERGKSFGQQTKRVFFNMATPIELSVESIQWRGAVAIALTQVLEEAGYQVELWAVSYCTQAYTNDQSHVLATLLKDVYGLLDVDSISTAISGWFYRSIWFSCKDRAGFTTSGHLGYPTNLNSEIVELVSGTDFNSEDDIIIGEVFSKWNAIYELKRILFNYTPPVPEEPVDFETETVFAESEKEPETPAQLRARLKREQREHAAFMKRYRKLQAIRAKPRSES